MDMQSIITELTQNRLMQLATVNNNVPWLCTVCFVTDEDNNVYWLSSRMRRHSQELLQNSSAVVTILSTGDLKQSLTIEGSATEVAPEALQRTHDLYCQKFGQKDIDLNKMAQRGPDGLAYWILTANRYLALG